MGQQGTKRGNVRAAERTVKLLELLRKEDGLRISEVSHRSGLPKSTVHRYLSTLEGQGYVVKEGDTYVVGTRLLKFGEYLRTRKEYFPMIQRKVSELADRTDERTQFIVHERGYGVYLHKDKGELAVRNDPELGEEVYLHATAAGKAILAYLPEPELETIFERRGLPSVTGETIVDRDALLEDLAETKSRGYSINRGESTQGLTAIGAPILDNTGYPLGGLSIAGPDYRVNQERIDKTLANLLLGMANEIQINISG